jgi:hypothetical protein
VKDSKDLGKDGAYSTRLGRAECVGTVRGLMPRSMREVRREEVE